MLLGKKKPVFSPVMPHRPLAIVAVAMALIAVVAAGGLLLDHRQLVGAPIWSKTFKFAVSIGLYTYTLGWLLSLLPKARRWGWWMGTVVAAGLAFEMVLIFVQTIVRGRRLHFNFATESDRLIHNQMATAAYLVWVVTLVVAVLLLFQRLPDRALASGVRAGLFVALTGMALGMLMFTPTPAQQAMKAAGQRGSGGLPPAGGLGVAPQTAQPEVLGSHSVGVPEGGPGLPLLGWSTTGGDLRIPHFFGLHALQLLPLLAIGLNALARRFPALGPDLVRRRLVRIAAAGYLALVVVLTWQALRGQPLVHPDGWTLLAVGGLAAAVVAAAWFAVRCGGRKAPR